MLKKNYSDGSRGDFIGAVVFCTVHHRPGIRAAAAYLQGCQAGSGLNLVDFATGVIASLVAGMLIIIPLMFQKELFGQNYIAWTWWCPIGTVVTTAICLLGKSKKVIRYETSCID